ncbi:MAG: hypothetical protein R2795_00550 [Saprospiraceae bacterium]
MEIGIVGVQYEVQPLRIAGILLKYSHPACIYGSLVCNELLFIEYGD